jgi:hypothetical protein
MPFATIAGNTYAVQVAGAMEEGTEQIGQVRRAFGGNYRRSVRAEKGVFHFTLAPILPAALATLKTNIALGVLVTCTGDFNGGVSRSYYVRITQCGYFKPDQGQGMYRVPTLELREN